MRPALFIPLIGLALSSCVDPATETGTATQEVKTYCLTATNAIGPVPTYQQWNYALPPDTSSNQVFVVVPFANGQSFGLYQVTPDKNRVDYASTLTSSQVPYAMYLASIRPGTAIRIRGPVQPPWPPTDQGIAASQLNAMAHNAIATATLPAAPY
ncbi:MAG: hypothetical protein IPL61_16215 [Myxococcales bacterium]|nr:hypothetical protein [Myxococcales bacterium]